jgi:hypothetical protein
MKTVRLLTLLALAWAPWGAQAEPSLNSMVVAGLLEPFGITVDNNSQNYYITDSTHRIFKYNSMSGQLTVIAGTTSAGFADGLGIFSQFTAPRGILFYNNPTTANKNCLIVADSGNHVIRLISNLDKLIVTVTNIAGQTGTPAWVDDLNGANARFNNPVGLATDGINIFVADSKNNAIRKLTPSGNAFSVTTIAQNFYEPMALAVGDQGQIFVADTRNNAIKVLVPLGNDTYRVDHLAGSLLGVSGATDDLFATNALFNRPSGLVWQSSGKSLLVSDTANHALRRVYYNDELSVFLSDLYGQPMNIWSVETFAGILGKAGMVDGTLYTAELSSPAQISDDGEQGTLIADTGNNAIRRVQINAALPQVSQPVIGYVTWVENALTGEKKSLLVPIKDAIFDHFDSTDPIIAMLGEANTIYYTEGDTPGLLETDTIPQPDFNNSQLAPPYQDGLPYGTRILSIMSSPRMDWTIKARGIAPGRRPSDLYIARIQFKVASPYFASDNPAAIVLECGTAGATLWYTLDGSDPVEYGYPASQGPYSSGDTLSVANQFTDSVVMKVRAFAQGFQPSGIATKTLSLTSYKANKIMFGFENGEASSSFIGSAGQWFLAPITMSLLPGTSIYSLQFAARVNAINGAPAVTPGYVNFETMLLKPTLIPGIYTPIYPGMYFVDTNAGTVDFVNLVVTNATDNLLMVGWLERRGQTLLYDSTKQNLLTYSQAHDIMYNATDGKVVVGTYKFQVPLGAPDGSEYQIELIRPSATADGISLDVFIDTPTNGSLNLGAINALKRVKVGRAQYIVGDLAPFRWFNAGDFGDTNLLNNDLLQAFQSIAYQLNQPPLNSDFLDAMDANDASLNSALSATNGDSTAINNVTLGDGTNDVTDLYVIFRRSLDPSLKWFARYREGGALRSVEVPNKFRGHTLLPGERVAATTPPALPPEAASIMTSTEPPAVHFSAQDLQGVPGSEARALINARISGPYPIRVLMLNVTVQNLDGAPPITTPIQFLPQAQLGQPAFHRSAAPNNYCAAWLDASVEGLWGDRVVGTLVISIPNSATPESSYRISFDHVSASPNGLGVIPQDECPGLITLGDHNASIWQDEIPDHWRLRYFGSVHNLLSQAMADADGDGVPNWAEYKAGTNPTDVRSVLKLLSHRHASNSTPNPPPGVTLRWPSILGKQYSIEWTYSLSNSEWFPLQTDVPGSGNLMEVVDTDTSVPSKVYRVRLTE